MSPSSPTAAGGPVPVPASPLRSAAMRMVLLCVLAGPAVLALPGCAGLVRAPVVDWTVESCCDDLDAYETFTLTMENLPGFLEPYFYTEVVPVMQDRGLRFLYLPDAQEAPDLVVWLAYEQVDMEDPVNRPDGTRDSYGIADPVRFLARIRVEFVDAASGATVASGVLARIHNAPTGGYMHEARARQAIRTAFAELVDALTAG